MLYCRFRFLFSFPNFEKSHLSYFLQITIAQVKYGGRSPKFIVGSLSRDVHSCTHWLRPRNSPSPGRLDSYYEGAIGPQRQTTSLCNHLHQRVRETHYLWMTLLRKAGQLGSQADNSRAHWPRRSHSKPRQYICGSRVQLSAQKTRPKSLGMDCISYSANNVWLSFLVLRSADPGIRCFFDPCIRDKFYQIPYTTHISESLVTLFWVKKIPGTKILSQLA